ncbi:Polyribonucleotide nucleotidyltransferase [bioreactor metagenome]|uniref:polyribonucleotide nucleotidyltransferase n=1 Tax=bioreactor metagenome TaxID=1076179 RepID=A0A644V3V3_9ZZZZ|nr:polyribonucleotide nucleotidyltransferase [Lentimicrobium sp.]MEA5112006.1 polyribonucleotide nucleotidyltransferase [Lentimicrobium sp.]
MQGIVKTFDIGDGRSISIETGRLAKQADGAVVVKMGDTMLLATVVARKEAGENVDFMPLTVEYREKYAAAGRFPGGFFKREARPSDYEVLIARLVDRALRPLFPDDFHAETQVIITLISADENILPDALAGLAASAALAVSDIPFNGPISEVRVARIDGKFVVNPHTKDIPLADLDIMVAASMDNIMMVEGEMKEVSEADMIEAIKFAHEHIKIQCNAQLELAAMVEKANPKRTYCHETNDAELKEKLHAFAYQRIIDIASNPTAKHERSDAFAAIREEFIATLDPEEAKEKEFMITRYYHDVEKEAVRNVILDKRQRLDGRKLDQIRPIWCEVDYLPAVHGSAIFTRGETQSLTTVTLGTKLDEQVIDGAVIEEKINFILHYNFPPFSTGEVKRIMGTSRREIGHGNLALRALKPMIPNGEENPYTIRVVSDILESNGSSSMATVCAGTMALMDAGVKIRKPVSGIAMGLISDTKTSRFAVLSDILGDEDHLGDMDFKVTGTVDGITACQMDIKVDGMPYEVLAQALEQAKAGRLHILGEMMKAISTPREDYKPHVPRIVKMTIPKEFIGAVIGPGGKVIQEMQRETGSTIVIEEVGDFGIIDIVSNNKESIEAVKDKIKRIVAIPEIGTVYHGVVKNITTFGAFVEVLPGKDGLLHISEIEHRRLDKVESALKVGDEIDVKLIDIDSKTGKLKLSRKVLLPKPEPDQK